MTKGLHADAHRHDTTMPVHWGWAHGTLVAITRDGQLAHRLPIDGDPYDHDPAIVEPDAVLAEIGCPADALTGWLAWRHTGLPSRFAWAAACAEYAARSGRAGAILSHDHITLTMEEP